MGRPTAITLPEPACAATLDFDVAQAIHALHAQPLGVETVPLAGAAGRTLADPVIARIESSRRDSAAMDGYAVRGNDLASGAPLRIAGTRYAGAADAGSCRAKQSVS